MMLQINYVDGGKQAAISVFVPIYFLNNEMDYDSKKKTKFLKSRSKYAVLSDLPFTVYSDKLTFDVNCIKALVAQLHNLYQTIINSLTGKCITSLIGSTAQTAKSGLIGRGDSHG